MALSPTQLVESRDSTMPKTASSTLHTVTEEPADRRRTARGLGRQTGVETGEVWAIHEGGSGGCYRTIVTIFCIMLAVPIDQTSPKEKKLNMDHEKLGGCNDSSMIPNATHMVSYI